MSIKIGIIAGVIQKEGMEALKTASELGFEGVEFFVPPPWKSRQWLCPDFQQELLSAAEVNGVQIPSLTLAYMNQHPLASRDEAARSAVVQSILDYIPVAKAVGAHQMLLAFYGDGELAFGRDKGAVIESLKKVAPAAEEAGVKLGIESSLTTEQYIHIIEEVGSSAVNIYLDTCNPYNFYLDTAEQILGLGKHMGQIHFKEGSHKEGAKDLTEGFCDWDAITAALKAINYDGWAVLETSSLSGDPIADARKNLERARALASRCQ